MRTREEEEEIIEVSQSAESHNIQSFYQLLLSPKSAKLMH